MSGTWLVLPTYNEAETLTAMFVAVRATLPAPSVLVVDDGAPDGTGQVADQFTPDDARVHVLHRATKRGLAGAYVAGLAHMLAGGAGLVVQMDADFSHDPADLPRLVQAIEGGAGLAIGSRYVPGGHRRLVGRAAVALPRRRDLHATGARAAGARPDRRLQGLPARSAARDAQRRGVRVPGRGQPPRPAPRPAHRRAADHSRERRAGQSKMSARIALEAPWRIPALRRRDRSNLEQRLCAPVPDQ